MRTTILFSAGAVAVVVATGIAHFRSSSPTLPQAMLRESSPTAVTPAIHEESLDSITKSMSVGEAYRAIPHQRTPFDDQAARMEVADAAYLDRLFVLTDIAMVERVQSQLWLQSGGKQGSAQGNHRSILAHLNALESPDRLQRVHTLIREAIEEQHRYLSTWQASGRANYFSPSAPLILSSHGKLIGAYSELQALYPGEGAHNRQAFFDHLCALDFI